MGENIYNKFNSQIDLKLYDLANISNHGFGTFYPCKILCIIIMCLLLVYTLMYSLYKCFFSPQIL